MAVFKDKFFIELYKILSVYGKVYVVEDGNIYLKQNQAENRIQSTRKLSAINGELETEMRYAVCEINNPPTCAEELEKLFEAQDMERRKKARIQAEKNEKEETKIISDAEAKAALEQIKKKSKSASEKSDKKDVAKSKSASENKI